ncbi:hypothetical protein NEMBOFW57_004695 [Staphylotrichum longicolle]|uniref:Uncharacterized protein n=1 Tax=Staphylotrichum longicolle TaxID=669026 RepID=A0AAD4I0Q6_9PEZI|nr:hypothetical protein NEMBOFW57_004695 [Staphylotrichum longicolle]
MLSPLSQFLVLTSLIPPLTASPLTPPPPTLSPRQPTPNPFDFLDLRASAIASSARALTSSDRCAAALFGTGYDGVFNLTMNLSPGNSRTTRARTRCATAVEQPEMVLDVWVSLAHEQIDVDDAQVHKGSVSDVSVGFVVMWEKCGS